MIADTAWWEAFPKQVARAIHPLAQKGLRLVGVETFPPNGSVQQARLESTIVGIDIWLDPRGELDAALGRLSIFGEGYYAQAFGPSTDPLHVHPPYLFGIGEGATTLDQALDLLVAYLVTHAADALEGQGPGFRRASDYKPSAPRLP